MRASCEYQLHDGQGGYCLGEHSDTFEGLLAGLLARYGARLAWAKDKETGTLRAFADGRPSVQQGENTHEANT